MARPRSRRRHRADHIPRSALAFSLPVPLGCIRPSSGTPPPYYSGHPSPYCETRGFPTAGRPMHTSALWPFAAPSPPTPAHCSDTHHSRRVNGFVKQFLPTANKYPAGKLWPPNRPHPRFIDASWSHPLTGPSSDVPTTSETWRGFRVPRKVLLGQRHREPISLG